MIAMGDGLKYDVDHIHELISETLSRNCREDSAGMDGGKKFYQQP